MLTIVPQSLYLHMSSGNPELRPEPVVALMIDDDRFGVVGALVLDTHGNVSSVREPELGQRKFTQNPEPPEAGYDVLKSVP